MDLIEDAVNSFVVTLRTDSGIISSGKAIMNYINRGVRNKRINGHFQITLRHNICVNKWDTIYINTQALAKQSAFLTAVLNVYERIYMTSLWDYMVTGQRYELKAEDLLDKNASVFQKMSVIPFMFVGEVLKVLVLVWLLLWHLDKVYNCIICERGCQRDSDHIYLMNMSVIILYQQDWDILSLFCIYTLYLALFRNC